MRGRGRDARARARCAGAGAGAMRGRGRDARARARCAGAGAMRGRGRDARARAAAVRRRLGPLAAGRRGGAPAEAANEGAFTIEGDPCGGLVFRDGSREVIDPAPPLPSPGPTEPAEPWSLVATDGSPVQHDYVFDVLMLGTDGQDLGQAMPGARRS
jgi:hypothetical protein